MSDLPQLPHEPEAFAERVAGLLRSLRPDYAVELIGPRELLVNGRRLDLENLFRMVSHEPERARRSSRTISTSSLRATASSWSR